ncbi:MAG: NADH-quinone oxidoreductase subunit NuoG [Rickettsiales bacterium]|nr:NADH-quinone oxidoreductase subunit NuoG [Rickettsiales bacterium]
MPKLKIDGNEYEYRPGMTVIQVCDENGIEIPRFCYHERLKIAGNCRMCLVEVKPGPPKPQASCALPAAENMEVQTASPMVKKAREGVMEFLLINHPLDCPICDQGGECDLQDQALMYGKGISRYEEHKRSVEDKHMGPIIETHMTRCIHCTRCIRFIDEVAGMPELGAMGRGEHMEVTTYLEKAVASELSGNVVDLCPVGALTSKPYAFVARPWELVKTESIDVMDAVGSNIRVDSRFDAVLRVLPRMNDDINEEWISDKTRHAIDGLRVQRLDRPFIRENGKLRPASWDEALGVVAAKLSTTKGEKIAALAGNLCDVESMLALKELMLALGSPHLDCRQDGALLDASDRASYLFNTTIAGIEQADLIVMVGTNPRFEAPLVNARIRKRFLKGGLAVHNIGAPVELTYPVTELGNQPSLLSEIASGKHPLAEAIKNAKNPMLIIGMAALAHESGEAILGAARSLPLQREGWNGFNVLHNAAARVGGLEIGFVPQAGGKGIEGIVEGVSKKDIEVLYLLGVDEIDMDYFKGAFKIYQGHHGDIGAQHADVILPGTAYTEKDATYVNLEGRPQRSMKAVTAPGEAKEDWRILRALSEQVGKTLPYNTLPELRRHLVQSFPIFANMGEIAPAAWKASAPAIASIAATAFEPVISNFYRTDPISRVSKTMAECTKQVWPQLRDSAKEAA